MCVRVANKLTRISCETDAGEVFLWGWNNYGRLGVGDLSQRLLPTQVLSSMFCNGMSPSRPPSPPPSGGGATRSRTESLMEPTLLGGHEQEAEEAEETDVVGSPQRAVKIVCSFRHSLVLTDMGNLFAFGWNEHGQLGIGSTDVTLLPHQVKVNGETVRFVDCAAGDNFSIGVSDDGHLFSWGSSSHGKLGNPAMADSGPCLSPMRIPSPNHVGLVFVQASCGKCHTLALTDSGRVFSFGDGEHGQLGQGHQSVEDQPTEIPMSESGSVFSMVSCGGHLSCLVPQPPTHLDILHFSIRSKG